MLSEINDVRLGEIQKNEQIGITDCKISLISHDESLVDAIWESHPW